MVIIHQKERPFSDLQIQDFITAVHQNIIEAMGAVLDFITSKPDDYPLEGDEAAFAEEVVKARDQNTMELTKELGEKVVKLHQSASVQKAIGNSHEFQFPERATYFFDNIDRICSPDFKPTTEDILSVRRRTTGVHEINFVSDGVVFRMIDVGGQRSERRKWFHCFEDVTAIIFIVAISEYNQVLFEDEKTNRMHESLTLFEEIAGSKWFEKTAIILFLNKKDLFKEKIEKYDLKICFPNYKGGCDYEKALQYITRRFKKAGTAKDKDKTIYTHVTFALDTENIKIVFGAVRDTILKHALSGV
jgi:guanine nucleotide-binding protein G(o) subunit alpha